MRDPYAATYFEPGCTVCDGLWEEMCAATRAPDWEEQVQAVTVRVQAHARDAHDLTLAGGDGTR